MTFSINRYRSAAFFAVLAGIIYAAAFFGTRVFEAVPGTFVLGATLDVAITVPALFYLFLIRKKRSILFIFPAALVSYVIATFILPGEHHKVLDLLFYVLLALETAFAAIIVYKIGQTVRHFKIRTDKADPFQDRLKASLTSAFLDKLPASLLASEISMFYYLFASRKSLRQPLSTDANAYTYHEKSGCLGILIMIVHLLVLEGIGMHVLLMHWSHTIAWIAAGSNLYAVAYFISDYKATKRMPIVVSNEAVTVRIGIRKKLVVPISSIHSLKTGSTSYAQDRKRKDVFLGMPLLSMEEPKVEIELNAPLKAWRPFGDVPIRKVYLSVDEHDRFASQIRTLL